MTRFYKRFWSDRGGATAIEYGLIIALLSVVVAAAVTSLGGKLYNVLNNVVSSTH